MLICYKALIYAYMRLYALICAYMRLYARLYALICTSPAITSPTGTLIAPAWYTTPSPSCSRIPRGQSGERRLSMGGV